jgi:solute carrier family 45, member 1/2/4
MFSIFLNHSISYSIKQGIHNIFAVIPQFLITGIAAIIFAIFEPNKSILHSGNALSLPLVNGTSVDEPKVIMKEEGVNSFVIIFQ